MSIETLLASDKFNFFQTITPYRGTKKGLFIYRIICLIILCFGVICSIYATINRDPAKKDHWIYFAYFTNQTYYAIIIYFLIGIINYIRDRNGTLKGRAKWTFVHILGHAFYNILFTLAFLVTIIFWGMIFPKMNTSFFNLLHWCQEFIQHFFQMVMVGIDWYLITLPTSYAHFIPMFLVGIAYLIFALIYHAIYNVWIYAFLNQENKNWLILYIALVIGWAIFGLVFAGIQKFKNRNRKYVECNTVGEEIHGESIELV